MPLELRLPARVTGTDNPTALTIGKNGTAAAFSQGFGRPFQIYGVYVHASADLGVNDLTISIDSQLGAAYDTVLLVQAMNGLTNFFWLPEAPVVLSGSDDFIVSVANGAGRTIGLSVQWACGG